MSTVYNRYSPRQDGTYQRNRISEPTPSDPPKSPNIPPIPEQAQIPALTRQPHTSTQTTDAPRSPMHFITDLLPSDMDTGDMLVLLVLLLLAADGNEDSSNPLLTLALFFLMGS